MTNDAAVVPPHPRSALAWIPVTSPAGASLPVLFLPDGEVCYELYAFLRRPGFRGKSGTWQRLHADAVRLLYDFYAARGRGDTLTQERLDSIMADFVDALLYGTVQPDGTDATGLFWRPRGRARVHQLLQAIHRFGMFLSEEGAVVALNPTVARRVATLRESFAFEMRRRHSMLAHLKENPGQPSRAPRFLPFERALAHAADRGRPIPFPKPLEPAFFSQGLLGRRQRNVADGVCPHTIRDTLYFLLLMYGGLRKSEPLHLFLHDVVADTESGQGACVFLYHPEIGVVHGERIRRAEYLWRNYGLVPRNRLAPTDPRSAGWKSMLMSEDVRGMDQRTRVFWRNPEAGHLFWELHRTYIGRIRPKNPGHPYYFVNLAGTGAGDPMTRDAADEAFERALRRLGLTPNAAMGLSPHAMRHRYAQALVDAKLDPAVIQLCLHHRSLASQLVYTRPMPHQIIEILGKAATKIEQGIADFDPSSLGIHWKSDPLGIFTRTAPIVRTTLGLPREPAAPNVPNNSDLEE